MSKRRTHSHSHVPRTRTHHLIVVQVRWPSPLLRMRTWFRAKTHRHPVIVLRNIHTASVSRDFSSLDPSTLQVSNTTRTTPYHSHPDRGNSSGRWLHVPRIERRTFLTELLIFFFFLFISFFFFSPSEKHKVWNVKLWVPNVYRLFLIWPSLFLFFVYFCSKIFKMTTVFFKMGKIWNLQEKIYLTNKRLTD